MASAFYIHEYVWTEVIWYSTDSLVSSFAKYFRNDNS